MAVESANYIGSLVQAYPAGGEAASEGDDHLRLVKKVLQQTFPGRNHPEGAMLTLTGASVEILSTYLGCVVKAAGASTAGIPKLDANFEGQGYWFFPTVNGVLYTKSGDTFTGGGTSYPYLGGAAYRISGTSTNTWDVWDVSYTPNGTITPAKLDRAYAEANGTGASGTWGINVSGTAERAKPKRDDGVNWDFIYTNPGGMPIYYLGTSDGVNVKPYLPSAMTVGAASAANYATNAGKANGPYWTIAGASPECELHWPGVAARAWYLDGAGTLHWCKTAGDGADTETMMTLDGLSNLSLSTGYFNSGAPYRTAGAAAQLLDVGGHFQQMYWDGASVYSKVDATVFVLLGTVSDKRLKENITDYTDSALTQLSKLRAVRYNAKLEKKAVKSKFIGLLADEVEKVFPEFIVNSDPDEYEKQGQLRDSIPQDGKPIQSINYPMMVTVLVKALQEQLAINAAFETRLKKLEKP